MPDLPPVNEDFTADNSDFLAKVQEMIDKIQDFSDKLNEATGSVEELHAAIDDLPDQKTIRIQIESIANEYVEELHAALDELPMDKEIYIGIVGEADAQVRALEFALDELPKDKIIDITVVYNEVGKPAGIELPESVSVREIDQGVTQALSEGTQALEQAAEGTSYSAEVIGAEQLADAMGEIAETAPLAAEGAERVAIGAGDIGEAADDASRAVVSMGENMDELGSAERLAALAHASEYLEQIAESERASAGLPPAGTKVIPGIPIEDFLGPEEGEDAGDEFAAAAARAAETEAASAGMSDLARQMFGGPIEEDMARQGEQDADSWFKGLVGRLTTKAVNPDDIPHLPGVSDGKGAGGGSGGGGGGGGGSAYSGMFEGAIVAAGALAPFIAQAISGAITAGLGFALAGIGVYAAMQLAPVKAAFKDFEDTAKNDLASIGKVFEPVMLSIFHVATEVFGALTPVFAEAEKTIAGPFKVWADTFIRTFENPAVESSIEAVAKAFASILRVVTPELAGMATKFAGALIALVNNIAGHPDATRNFLNFLAAIPVAILNVLNVLTDIAEYTETHPLFKNLLDISAFEHMFNAIQDLFHGDFLSALKNFGDVFTSTFEAMANVAIDIWDTLPEGFRHGTDQIVDDIRKAFEDIPGLIKHYWDDAVKAVSGGWDDIVNALFGGGGGGIASKASGILGTLDGVWASVENATKVAWDDIKNAMLVPWNAAVSLVESLGNSFSSWWATHGQALETVWKTTWGIISGLVETAWGLIEGIIKIGIGVVTQAWDIFWNALVSTAKQAWAIIGPIVSLGWALIKGAFQVGMSATELVWNTMWSVIEAAARIAWDAVTALLKVGWDLVVGTFNIGVATVKAVWNILWSGIVAVAKTFWDAVEALIKVGWDLIVGIFSVGIDVITGHWSQAWNDIKTTAEQIWNAISTFFQQAFGNYENFFETVWNNIKNIWNTVWDEMKTISEQVWNAIAGFFDQAFNAMSSLFDETWNNIKNFVVNTWDDIENTTKSVWNSIMGFFEGIWSDISNGFNNAVSAIKGAWGKLQSIFDGPVNFLVHTVYDDGIAKLWNDVAGVIPGLPHLPTLAAGGKLPGYGGGDILPALLEPGETVVSKEHTQILASAFKAVGVPGFAHGGGPGPGGNTSTPRPIDTSLLPGGISLPGGGVLGDIAGFIKDVASIGAAVLTGNTTALLNDMTKLIGAGGATGALASMITGIPKAMIKALISEATSVGAKDAAALAAGPAGGATGSEMANGAELYQYLLTNVFGGHKIAAAGAIASIWGECVTLDHKILTKRGYLNHDEVTTDDETMGYNPETDKSEWTPITRVVHYEQKPVITLYSGKWSSTFTPNHRWLTEEGMKKYTDLTENDKIVLSREADTGESLPITAEEAVYIGCLARDHNVKGQSLSPEQQKDLTERAGDPKLDALYQVLHMSSDQRKEWLKAILATDLPVEEREVIHHALRKDGVVANAIELALFFEGYHRDMPVSEAEEKSVSGFEDVWCVTTGLGSWTARKDAFSFFTGNSEWNPLTSGTGGRGLIGWTPEGTISNAAFEGGMKTQEPAIIAFINSSGDQGVIREMESATSVSQAANEWGVGVERYGIDDVHAEGIALATSIMNSGGGSAPATKEADALAKAAQTHDAGGWLYPGVNIIHNKTGGLERTVGPNEQGQGGMIHNVLNVDGKTIFEAVKPYVYQYNSRNSGNGRVNGTWRPS